MHLSARLFRTLPGWRRAGRPAAHADTAQAVRLAVVANHTLLRGGSTWGLYGDWCTAPTHRVSATSCPGGNKPDQAVFAGATTGRLHTVASVQARSSPHLRVGRCIQGSPRLRIHLPTICTCQPPWAKAAIRAPGFAGGSVPWDTQ